MRESELHSSGSVANTIVTLWVLQKSGNFLPSSATIDFSRRYGGIRNIVDMINTSI
jgi:hypothetical protein